MDMHSFGCLDDSMRSGCLLIPSPWQLHGADILGMDLCSSGPAILCLFYGVGENLCPTIEFQELPQ